ncbi:hypothetical protein PCE31106_00115 [Pandoraea cepalis]|uniref:Uncharacterized protein n=1 Tax=Pandoraea cepalis TaxID=2508294 RepID=A0A5E4RHI5_9BURK|nr:hypothetical protein [Pandoraea cepalis]VVD61408.1 hypothetical protein PCE31106_00115 [Pandoraea cepalis]
MNRKDYTTARRLLCDNGRYALRWLPADHAALMDRLMFSTTRDDLAERAFASEYDRRLMPRADWQTQARGTNDAEYAIYRANAEALGWTVKTYDEWLAS